MKTPEIDLPKPQTNYIKDLIEYQNIYQFYIQKITLSNYEQTYKKASALTNEILNDNYKDKKNIILKTEHLDRLNKIREHITNGSKNLLIQWEEILECSNEKFIEANYKEAMKRKPGRPKAEKKKEKIRRIFFFFSESIWLREGEKKTMIRSMCFLFEFTKKISF